ncbi:predicted protein [Plenodomus lingam JN3]|uniref:Predicted protein n=1 Tax=Leptosphaeria maculans (strain JN3 / isolate v23.1.3 / race Av1-4-5-6-7-8) TaxID=985895 RepID=E5A241_LEPMJ|nr:predicted protein [Plenodomus lingam JN3]CBX97758.1 predicted protein [Plenodomus lingam JN3]
MPTTLRFDKTGNPRTTRQNGQLGICYLKRSWWVLSGVQ